MLIVTRNFNLPVGSAVALVGVVLVLLTVRYDVDLALAVLAAVASGVLGAFVGALLMGSLNNGMSPMNVPTFHQVTARGIVLLLAVTRPISRKKRRRTPAVALAGPPTLALRTKRKSRGGKPCGIISWRRP
jgi:ABC-type xylose transport system permease subunit